MLISTCHKSDRQLFKKGEKGATLHQAKPMAIRAGQRVPTAMANNNPASQTQMQEETSV